MVKLSIIIPIYKAEKYIHKCVDSVLQEAPTDSEIILVEDGSPDNCSSICDAYKMCDHRVKVIHKKNTGVSDSRNIGLDAAAGEYVFFIDSDDYIDNKYFEKLFEKKADLAIGSFVAFYEDLSQITPGLPSKTYASLSEYLEDFHVYFPVIFNTVWGKLYRRDLIEQYHIRFPREISMGEDLLFNIEYYYHCKKISFEADAVLMYRQGDETLSKKTDNRLFLWYQESYQKVKILLEDNETFSGENKDVFYRSLFGNTTECLLNAIKNNDLEFNKLCDAICKNTDVVFSAQYCKSVKVKFIAIAILKRNRHLIKLSVKLYELALTAKALWRKIH